MILTGGKELEWPKEVTNDDSLHDKNEPIENVEKEISSLSKEVTDDIMHKLDEVPKDSKTISPKPLHPTF